MADIKLDDLRKAFAMASNASENDRYDAETRKLLRQIARLIWKSVGKEVS